MTAKSDLLIEELVSACIAFGREREPNWQTRIETARCALKAHIEELEAEQRWIPVSERLPEAGIRVLAATPTGYMEVDWRFSEPIIDCGLASFYSLDNVTHWMPLPQPPEVQE